MQKLLLNILFVILLPGIMLIGCGREQQVDIPAHEAFFNNVSAMCGKSFAGETDFTLLENHPLADGRLLMHVESCTDHEIRIPFIVNNDSSRTWVLTLSEDGLLFQHDHRHADGTPEDTTMYGGWATFDGTEYIQRFPADDYTAALIPDAETNVWMFEIDNENKRFIYYLERHDEPRFRAIFDISRDITELHK